jgi:ABC-type nitrate/sulfonate/bicarbonate transport system permease component
VADSTWNLLVSGRLLDLMWTSNQSLVIGTGLALVLGVPFGILLGRSARLDRFLNVFITISLSTPIVALLPLIIVLFGLGLPARAFFVFLISFDTVVSMVRTGVQRLEPVYLEMADCFAARWYHVWGKVILPGIVPTLAGAVRVAVSRGLIGMIIIELTLVSVGIGGFIMRQRVFFRPNDVFAGVLIICVEAIVLSILTRKLQQRLAPRGIYGTGDRGE